MPFLFPVRTLLWLCLPVLQVIPTLSLAARCGVWLAVAVTVPLIPALLRQCGILCVGLQTATIVTLLWMLLLIAGLVWLLQADVPVNIIAGLGLAPVAVMTVYAAVLLRGWTDGLASRHLFPANSTR